MPGWSSHFYPTSLPSMAKKSTSRKKGVQQGISKYRVRGKRIARGQDGESNEAGGPKFLGISQSKVSSFGEKCFDLALVGCEKLYLIGIRRTESGEYVPVGRRAQILHYVAIFCLLALFMQRMVGTVEVFLYEGLGMQSFMCLSLVSMDGIDLLVALGVLMRPKETMDLLNSWSHFSASLKMIDPSWEIHPLDNMSACMKVTGDFLVHHGIVLAVGLGSVIVKDVPVCLFPTARRLGLLPEGILPDWAWSILFVPLESLVVWPFMLVGSFAASCLFMEIGALDEYLQRFERMKVRSIRSRQRFEQMYVQLELFNRIAQVWIRFYFPPWLVGLSSGVILAVFFTVRYTDVPLILYIVFPYIAMTLMVLIFWQSYDMLRTTRASADILGRLCQHHAPYFQGMTRAERIEKMKRSGAMRNLVFPLGDTEFSIDLPINTWDEILNQTLFLLSL